MFPFFKPKGSAGSVLILDRNSENDIHDEPDDLNELEAAMHPLMKALEMKDARAMAQAFSDAFQIADASPHVEYPHDSEQQEEE